MKFDIRGQYKGNPMPQVAAGPANIVGSIPKSAPGIVNALGAALNEGTDAYIKGKKHKEDKKYKNALLTIQERAQDRLDEKEEREKKIFKRDWEARAKAEKLYGDGSWAPQGATPMGGGGAGNMAGARFSPGEQTPAANRIGVNPEALAQPPQAMPGQVQPGMAATPQQQPGAVQTAIQGTQQQAPQISGYEKAAHHAIQEYQKSLQAANHLKLVGSPEAARYAATAEGWKQKSEYYTKLAEKEYEGKKTYENEFKKKMAAADAKHYSGFGKTQDRADKAIESIERGILQNADLEKYSGQGALGMLETATGLSPWAGRQEHLSAMNIVKSYAFQSVYQELKGGGAITEIEGQKAEQALVESTRTNLSAPARRYYAKLAIYHIRKGQNMLAQMRTEKGIKTKIPYPNNAPPERADQQPTRIHPSLKKYFPNEK